MSGCWWTHGSGAIGLLAVLVGALHWWAGLFAGCSTISNYSTFRGNCVMAIKYRVDHDLEFLATCSNEDIEVLVKYLTIDKDNNQRMTQELLSDPDFIACGRNYAQAWKSIAGEIQLFGGDSVSNTIRRNGVPYKEVLCDVCKKLGVNFNKKRSVIAIEKNLLDKIMEVSFESLSEDEKKELLGSMKIDPNLVGAAALAALIQAINMSAILSYQTAAAFAARMVASRLGQVLVPSAVAAKSILFNNLLRVAGGLTGPFGMALTALLVAPSITGPAYRVTVPCVIQIAYMRRKQQLLISHPEALLLSNDFFAT